MKIVMSCGGTGGHIYPAIAIADKIREHHPEAEILFIGTKKGMENSLVPAAGYEIKGIDARGFDRKHLAENFKTLHTFFEGTREVGRILKDFAPDIAVGTGGYVTGSVISKAHGLGIKCFIHEQNALPGLANRFLSGFADKVFTSFAGTEDRFRHPDRVIMTGNPVRGGFVTLDRAECREKLGLKDGQTMVLLFGGSLGAEVLNREALGLVKKLSGNGIRLFFVSGRRHYEEIKEKLDAMDKDLGFLTFMPYADNMPELMCASDLVVSRAGAIAVSEIAVCGKPSVLVPSPNVTDNHQFYNAKAVADADAAVLIEEKDLPEGEDKLAEAVLALASDKERLSAMSEAAKKLARPDAADIIYKELGLDA